VSAQPPEAVGSPEPAAWQPGSEEIERRAVQGVTLMVVRNVGVQAFTFMGTVALSRLLTPRQYGNFAIALTFQIVGRFLSDLGLAAAMIRRREEMSAREEQSVTAISVVGSLAVSGALALAAFVLAPAFGVRSELLDVAALTSFALPLYSARVIPVVWLERRLDYRRLTWIEVADPLVFYAFAIPAALAGLGTYSLAGAVVAAAGVGSVIATVMRPWSFGLRIDLDCIRPMLGFSLRASILAPLYLLREFLVLVALAAIGGPAQAGFYNLAQRLFSLNLSIAYAVQRVTQTAFARGEAGTSRDRRGAQTSIVTTVTAALPLAVVVGTAHISVGLVFGARWHPTVALVLAAAAGWLLMSGPISVLTSLALAHGDARAPLRAVATQGLLAVGLTAGLVPLIGIAGAGLAVTCGALGAVVVFVGAGAPEIRALVAPTLKVAVVSGIAIAVGEVLGGRGPVALVLVGLACLATWLALAAALLPGELRLVARLLLRNLRRGGRKARADPSPPGR
jgi:PST family polysaccharide transporter